MGNSGRRIAGDEVRDRIELDWSGTRRKKVIHGVKMLQGKCGVPITHGLMHKRCVNLHQLRIFPPCLFKMFARCFESTYVSQVFSRFQISPTVPRF